MRDTEAHSSSSSEATAAAAAAAAAAAKREKAEGRPSRMGAAVCECIVR